ncbi:sucrose synthase 2-like protein [Corchorus olitorius]|uniref:Sucrose synthase 2-like protein n=1 Tax=Corchorus olitorius TaxID=93759 RepID=A0A1R3IRV6_9ROSI|nr:sucrose synthase 2-like protein [Corchorus olitorius]
MLPITVNGYIWPRIQQKILPFFLLNSNPTPTPSKTSLIYSNPNHKLTRLQTRDSDYPSKKPQTPTDRPYPKGPINFQIPTAKLPPTAKASLFLRFQFKTNGNRPQK